jgi:hypothetical protein
MLVNSVSLSTVSRCRSKNPTLAQGRKPPCHVACLRHEPRQDSRERPFNPGRWAFRPSLTGSYRHQIVQSSSHSLRWRGAACHWLSCRSFLTSAASVPLDTLRHEGAARACQRLAAERIRMPPQASAHPSFGWLSQVLNAVSSEILVHTSIRAIKFGRKEFKKVISNREWTPICANFSYPNHSKH